jgi:hypothetical protein
MQKIFGVLLILLAVWVGIEIYTQGMDGAFGGLFASHSGTQRGPQTGGGLPDQVRDRVKGAVRTNEERTLQHMEP